MEADPTQMQQLFQNIIGNALKYHGDRPPIVRITSTEGPEGEVLITIEDNGIGFEEKYADRIFAPFQRLHGRSEYEGTGMGLAICRKIVERHGGTITAHSEPGQGSTFLISLPAKRPNASLQEKPSAS
jgi:signal transduction histidine kinase